MLSYSLLVGNGFMLKFRVKTVTGKLLLPVKTMDRIGIVSSKLPDSDSVGDGKEPKMDQIHIFTDRVFKPEKLNRIRLSSVTDNPTPDSDSKSDKKLAPDVIVRIE
ncbi:hypothetical protein L1987_00967 [Smallanthus sonchifolius]|uniref:Uncharacterized protein n=1 Tax=Smallanthus sonchifolius TaxID=185202 RepID=A0ACB9K3S7_9ASTR|nr:hypothetical protein L1987_00967 [Smallanthus sonchifolius]